MHVVAFNGSPKKEENTYQAIKIVADSLEKEGISTEIIHVGNKTIRGCIACGGCIKNKNEKCVIDDEVNGWIQKMKSADGIIIGSPVYYASIAGTMKCFLDRAFYVGGVNNGLFRHKVGASVVAVRRSGGVATYDHLNPPRRRRGPSYGRLGKKYSVPFKTACQPELAITGARRKNLYEFY